MKYDPEGTLGPKANIDRLIEQIAASGRELHVQDNVGHHMASASGPAASVVLDDLTQWLRERRQGFAPVLYFDLWIADADTAARLWP